jgi:hypothetical protein
MLCAVTTTVCGTVWLWCLLFRDCTTNPMTAADKAALPVIIAATTVSVIININAMLKQPNEKS